MPAPKPLVNLVADDQVKAEAKELFKQVQASTGKVPKWMRVMANCEDVLFGFFTLFKAVMDDAPADKMLKWKVAYRVSQLNKCEFCVDVAESKLKTFGISAEEAKKLDEISNEDEAVALEYAAAATEHAYNIDSNVFAKMKERFSDEQIVEITSVVGLFNFINRFNDSLGVLPDINE